MSHLSGASDDRLYGGTVATTPEPESVLLPGHDVPLGRYTTVRRLLPQRQRRMVGAWCFVDHFGPEDVSGRPGMQVPPHPHTGLQTVTWLVDGEIVHRDSVGSDQSIRPGQLRSPGRGEGEMGPRDGVGGAQPTPRVQLTLMSSAHGIAHPEMPPPDHPPGMHGLQLWVALPEEARHDEPRFEHHADLPILRDGDATVTVLAGRFGSAESPARVHTPLVAVEVMLPGPGAHRLALDPAFEHGLLVMSGSVDVVGAAVAAGSLLHLAPGRSELVVEASAQ